MPIRTRLEGGTRMRSLAPHNMPCLFPVQLWADNCELVHSDYPFGENLGIGPVMTIIDLWYFE